MGWVGKNPYEESCDQMLNSSFASFLGGNSYWKFKNLRVTVFASHNWGAFSLGTYSILL